MHATLRWLQARAENVAVGLLTVMFLAFILQIFARYVLNYPVGWTLELCLTMWLWVVFWGSAFCLRDHDHVKFDILYHSAGMRMRRIFALVAAVAILAGFLLSLPATYDYITFYKIKRSSTLRIRLDYIFSVYGIFAVAMILTYGYRTLRLLKGDAPESLDQVQPR